jgi:2-polyprenyl-6-methoxyphenol hydroxylase-like FAD-dependent oxidoreductase
MTFHRGQGGNLAIKGADDLVTSLVAVQKGDKSLQGAIDDYDKNTLERGEEVAVSKAQAFSFHDYANFENSPFFRMGIKPVNG